MHNALETFLRDLRDIHNTGAAVKETSYYGPLANLFNEFGKTLKPKVRCVINLQNVGSGIPDGGFFTSTQFQRGETAPKGGQLPERGAIEIKSTKDDALKIAKDAQVEKYLQRYGLVLVTNYRDFILVAKGSNNKAKILERYTLAATEAEFWQSVADPKAFAETHAERFGEYLRRAMMHAAPLTRPEDVAWFLASYARDARARIEAAKQLPALEEVRKALETGLGLSFAGDKGEHFFRSTLVQTLFYGLFSAWVLWAEDHSEYDKFDWKSAEWELHLPVIRELFSQLSVPDKLRPLGLVEVMDWSAGALSRVVRSEFFTKFEQSQAVQYFYEPFLEAFDPDLRKQFGVWYTPPEVVRYMVERVDRVLRTELGLARGLADENVYVLDPCTGTGSYVVEVLRRIHQTLQDEGTDALGGDDLKQAALSRIFGFEIMPAPFVVAHLQIGLLLRQLGSTLSDEERPSVYLTNALTGWNKLAEEQVKLAFPGLEEERDAARKVKQETPILVILGNPPYNAFDGVSPKEEGGLVEEYKKGLIKDWGIKKFNLDDLYVRFFRIAERRIVKSGKGVMCYISNASYLGDPSYVVMRQHLLSTFDRLWLDNLNGDSRETGKLTPEGKPDPSIFSTAQNKEGIRVGTAIGLLVRSGQEREAEVQFRDFWGQSKREDLLESLQTEHPEYLAAKPDKANRHTLRPSKVTGNYLEWPTVIELAAIVPFNGPVERRGLALISIEKDTLEQRMDAYFDADVSDAKVESIYPSLMMTGNRIVGPEARRKLLAESNYDSSKVVRYPFKPYDMRWCYLDNIRPLFSEPSPKLLEHRVTGNHFFITRDTADKSEEGVPFYYSPFICDYDSISGHARHFPVLLVEKPKEQKDNGQDALFEAVQSTSSTKANLSEMARGYLANLGLPNPDEDRPTAELLWLHALAIGYSPAYLSEHADGIRSDWPRIPLPKTKEQLLASAALGKTLAALLDTETPVQGVTSGALRPELKPIAVVSRVGGGNLSAGDLEINAGWGRPDSKGVVMPGKGKVTVRPFTPDEANVL